MLDYQHNSIADAFACAQPSFPVRLSRNETSGSGTPTHLINSGLLANLTMVLNWLCLTLACQYAHSLTLHQLMAAITSTSPTTPHRQTMLQVTTSRTTSQPHCSKRALEAMMTTAEPEDAINEAEATELLQKAAQKCLDEGCPTDLIEVGQSQ